MTDIKKAIAANDIVNGGAYINPNSLVIPPTTVQKIDPKINSNNMYPSGVLAERFDDPRYYTGDAAT